MPSLANVTQIAPKLGRLKADHRRVVSLETNTKKMHSHVADITKRMEHCKALTEAYDYRIRTLESRYEAQRAQRGQAVLRECIQAYSMLYSYADQQKDLAIEHDDLLYGIHANEREISDLKRSITFIAGEVEPILAELGISLGCDDILSGDSTC